MKEKYMLREVFDALPSMVFVVDQDIRIQEYNAAAAELISSRRETVLQRSAGEILHCIQHVKTLKGCGGTPKCLDCIIKKSVNQALQGKRTVRQRTHLKIIRDDQLVEIYALVTVSPFFFRGSLHGLLVIEDISEIAELYNMIFICPVCRKMQDGEKTWMQVEAYFKNNWNVDCSHGYCPDCFKNELKKIRSFPRNGNDLPIID